MFHGDQRTVTAFRKVPHLSSTGDLHISTYDALNGIQLCQCRIPLPGVSELCACWTYEGAFQFAVRLETHGKSTINIYELQPTLTIPLHLLSSICMPPNPNGVQFSFSPVFSHVSLVTKTEVIILNTQDPKFLLQTKLGSWGQGVFSPNGCFFALKGEGEEIYIWQNAPTGYIPWSSFRTRFPVGPLLWSPNSVSILGWSELGFQLFHPDNSYKLLSSGNIKPNHQGGGRMMAYLTDGVHIAIAKKWGDLVTVLNYSSGIPLQLIYTGMQIQDIKAIDNTIIVVDTHKLASWKMEASGTAYSPCGVKRVTINEILATVGDLGCLVLSHNCSQIAFVGCQIAPNRRNTVFLYDVETQEILKSIVWMGFPEMQFSPDGYQLWLTLPIISDDGHKIVKLEIEGDWAIVEGFFKYNDIKNWWENDSLDSQAWSGNLLSLNGRRVSIGTWWVTDSRGSKLLWLPPNWRIKDVWDMMWVGNFLALLHCSHPLPIIIEFPPQSQSLPSHPNLTHTSGAYPTPSLTITT